jgi:hypothetical protein
VGVVIAMVGILHDLCSVSEFNPQELNLPLSLLHLATFFFSSPAFLPFSIQWCIKSLL